MQTYLKTREVQVPAKAEGSQRFKINRKTQDSSHRIIHFAPCIVQSRQKIHWEPKSGHVALMRTPTENIPEFHQPFCAVSLASWWTGCMASSLSPTVPPCTSSLCVSCTQPDFTVFGSFSIQELIVAPQEQEPFSQGSDQLWNRGVCSRQGRALDFVNTLAQGCRGSQEEVGAWGVMGKTRPEK